MTSEERRQVVKALRSAAEVLMAKRTPATGTGPKSPKAVYRYGSKPNQAPVMRYMREFLQAYAAAGNALMEGKHPGEHTERLQNLAMRLNMDLEELINSVEALS